MHLPARHCLPSLSTWPGRQAESDRLEATRPPCSSGLNDEDDGGNERDEGGIRAAPSVFF